MSCTIIISHYESLPFLRVCVRQIQKFKHPLVEQKIIIADQSREEISAQVQEEFAGEDLEVVRMQPLYSGYGIDYLMRYGNIQTEYVCQLHVDAFPVSKNWLYACIKLIEEGFAFVGQLHFISQPTDTIYYLDKMFFSMSPTFNVARTETYREMALEAGFTRFHERPKIDVPMEFKNQDWYKWAAADYWNRGSDDDVVAFCWEDNHREHDKLGLGLTGVMGIYGEEPGFGRIYDDLVFHFGSCRESIGVGLGMGQRYVDWTKRINEGFTDELIEEMLTVARSNWKGSRDRVVWDGKTKTHSVPSEELNKKIEELKWCLFLKKIDSLYCDGVKTFQV